jgi:hypothetical protein
VLVYLQVAGGGWHEVVLATTGSHNLRAVDVGAPPEPACFLRDLRRRNYQSAPLSAAAARCSVVRVRAGADDPYRKRLSLSFSSR